MNNVFMYDREFLKNKIEELKNEKSLIDSKIQSFQKQIEHIDKLEFYELNKEGREAYEIGC